MRQDSNMHTLALSHSSLPLDHGASCSTMSSPLPLATFPFLCPISWAVSLPLFGTTYPGALGPVPASVVKDAGWGFQLGDRDLSEASGDLLDEAQGSGQGQEINF